VSEVQRFVYGRRRGHKLRKGRLQLLDELLPRLEVVLPEAPDALIEPRGLFAPGTREVWLEIGFGAGEHLAAQASAHPEIGFIGCEPFINGVASLVQRIGHQGLGNVRVFPDDARLLIHRLAPGSIGRLFVLYPDPWPKTRHHKRRIVGPKPIERFATILRDDAELRLATDHADYARWMLRYLTPHPAFVWLAKGPADWRERPPDWPGTRYEAKALRAGRRPFYFSFRRVARPATGAGIGPD
jgi:tRNA (guanine-N7-)-methyltransferase